MKANERYTEGSSSSDNLKDTIISSISNRPHNLHSYRKPLRKFYNKYPNTCNSTAPENSQFQGRDYTYSCNRRYICYFQQNFPKWYLNVKVLNVSFLTLACIPIGK